MLTLYLNDWQDTVSLSPDHLTHIRARRLHESDPIRFTDGAGKWCIGQLALKEKKVYLNQSGHVPKPVIKKYLACAWSRPQAMDCVIEKSVEMGITDIIPLITEYIGLKLSAEDMLKRYNRFSHIMHNALSQCENLHIPQLHSPSTLANLYKNFPHVHWILLHPNTPQKSWSTSSQHYGVLIGPEGGWSSTEYQDMCSWVKTVQSLAPHILRVETAAIAGMTLMNLMESSCIPLLDI